MQGDMSWGLGSGEYERCAQVREELNNDPDNAMRIEKEWFNTIQCGLEYEAKRKPPKSRQVGEASRGVGG